jgi:hypothetical protein
MTPGFQRQKRRLVPGQNAMTDSTGHYRLSGLFPGRYAVAANNQNGNFVKMHPEAIAGETQQQFLYAVQYYPGAERGDDAALLTVQPGQEVSSIDFRLQSRAATSIEGKVMVPSGAVSVKDVAVNVVTQVSQDFSNRFVGNSGVTVPEYNFTQSRLAPGSYFLIAQATIDGRRYRGVQGVELGPQGLRGIVIPIEPGIDLSGNVSVEGPDASQHAAAFVNLVPGDDIPWNAGQLRAKVNKDGTFKIAGVPAGVWDIGVEPLPSAGYVKSMRLGDKDVLTDDMIIRATTAEPLKIVLSTRAATLQGDVQQGDQPARAVVLLAPAGKFRHVMSWYRVGSADEKGHFEIKNATPGEYRLYAFEEFDQRSVEDPDFLTPFENSGTPVTLREGPNGPEKLSLIPAGASPSPKTHADSAEVHP